MKKEIINKIKSANNSELINWLISLLNYGELPEEALAVYTEALSRGGKTTEKATWCWNNI